VHKGNKGIKIRVIMENKEKPVAPAETISASGTTAESTATLDDKVAKKEKRRTSKGWEVFRFIVTGVICSAIDFLIQYGLGKAFSTNLSLEGKVGDVLGWGSYLATSIGVAAGFIISMIVNFILSRKWVFQNVEKDKNYNTPKYFWIYAGLAAGGLLLGIGVQALCVYVCNASWGWSITLDPYGVSMGDLIVKLFTNATVQDWAFIIVFCIKTIVVLFYNYFTRKKIIFKAPKAKDTIDTASESVNKEVINLTYSDKSSDFADKGEKSSASPTMSAEANKDKMATNPSGATKEEKITGKAPIKSGTETVYCKPQFNWGKPITKKKASDIVYSSLEVYDKRKTSVTDTETAKKMIVDEVLKDDKAAKHNKLK